MVGHVFKKCISVLVKKPIRLWGLSLLASLLSALASIFGMLPIISIPITLTISAGMTLVYLDGYRGKEVDSTQIFTGFKSFGRVAGGMAWMSLWSFIWGMVPVYGIIKSYSYRFTPYILMTETEISGTEALKESMRRTNGLKGKLFLADLLIGLMVSAVYLIAFLFGMIPVVGLVFTVIIVLAALIVLPLLVGLVGAAFYEERGFIPVAPVPPVSNETAFFCMKCGGQISQSSSFCPSCGNPIAGPQQVPEVNQAPWGTASYPQTQGQAPVEYHQQPNYSIPPTAPIQNYSVPPVPQQVQDYSIPPTVPVQSYPVPPVPQPQVQDYSIPTTKQETPRTEDSQV